MKNTNLSYLILSLLLIPSIVLFYSCYDKINLIPEENQLLGIAIRGKLLKGNPSEVSVNIQSIFTFSSASRKFVKIESVSIQDTLGREFFLSVNGEIGAYIGFIQPGLTEFPIDYFQKYRIQVVTKDNNIYQSDFETLLPAPLIES